MLVVIYWPLLEYKIGSYTGNGISPDGKIQNPTQHITVGFRPSLVIISGTQNSNTTNQTSELIAYYGMSDGTNLDRRVTFNSDGFTVYYSSIKYAYLPDFDKYALRYIYIAFK